MSDPNPFSNSNAPQHNLVSKIISSPLLGAPYQVAVDLVDVHTAYALQIGSPEAPVIQEFVQNIGTSEYRVENIYANNIYGTINGNNVLGGTGINVTPSDEGSVVSANLVAGTGISFSIQDNAITVQNTLNFTAGFGISISDVSLPDEELPFGTRVISFIGSGSTGNPQVAGSPGEIPFIGQTGGYLIVDPSLSYNVTVPDPTLRVPTTTVTTVKNGGVIKLSTDNAGDSVIETGFEDLPGMGNVLSIQGIGATAATVTIDTIESFMGINKDPTVELDVAGQTIISYSIASGATTTSYQAVTGGTGITGAITLAPGTYQVYGWGQGGAANGGAGGAGGCGVYEFDVASAATFAWTGAYGGASGGGNALVVTLGGVEKFIVPGGGAGVTGGTGGGGGNITGGLPAPEGGAVGGSTASYAEYTDTRYYEYTTTGGTITGTEANNESYTNALSGYITQGMTMLLSKPAVLEYNQTSNGVTYTLSPGTTISIETSGISFVNADLIIPGGSKLPLVDVTGLTVVDVGVTGAGTGGASYNNWVNAGNSGGVSFINSIVDTGQASLTYTNGTVVMSGGPYEFVTGDTFTFFFQGSINETQANQNFSIGAGTTMITSAPLGGTYMIGLTFTSTGTVALPNGSVIDVAERYFRNSQPAQSGNTGGLYGGGGFIGGGAPSLVVGVTGMLNGTVGNQPAGGGGGAYLDSGVSGITYPGQGPIAFKNNLNRAGYGNGATGTGTPGSQYLVLQQKTTNPTLDAALEVNGDSIFNGTVQIDTATTGPAISMVIGATAQNSILAYGRITCQALSTEISPSGGNYGYTSYTTGNTGGLIAASFPLGISTSGTIYQAGIASGLTIKQGTLRPNAVDFTYGDGSGWRARFGKDGTPTLEVTDNGTVFINGVNNALQLPNGSLIAAGVQSTQGFTSVVSNVGAPAYFPLGITSSSNCNVGALTLVAGGTAQNFFAQPGSLQTLGRVNISGDPTSGPSVGYALTVSGVSGTSFAADCYGSDFIIRSDSRLKENVVTVDSALDKVMKMRGVYFNKLDDPIRRIGVIAQEVESVLPEVVHTDDSPDQMKAVSYANIVGLLIEAIKEQQKIIKQVILQDQSNLQA